MSWALVNQIGWSPSGGCYCTILLGLHSCEVTISPPKAFLKMIFPFPKVGYGFVPWRLYSSCPQRVQDWTAVNGIHGLGFLPRLLKWDGTCWIVFVADGFSIASIGNIRDIQAIWRYTTLRHYVDQLSSKHSKVGIGRDMALVFFFVAQGYVVTPVFAWDFWFAILYRECLVDSGYGLMWMKRSSMVILKQISSTTICQICVLR